MKNSSFILIVLLKLLHASNEGVDAFDSLGIVAAGAESSDAAVTLDANHTTLGSEVEEWLLQFLVLVVHNEADVHE